MIYVINGAVAGEGQRPVSSNQLSSLVNLRLHGYCEQDPEVECRFWWFKCTPLIPMNAILMNDDIVIYCASAFLIGGWTVNDSGKSS